jgi:hypothetical protein
MVLDSWALTTLVVAIPLLLVTAPRVMRAIATLPALALVPLLSRRLSLLVGARHYDENELLRADGADPSWIDRRRRGLQRLANRWRRRIPRRSAGPTPSASISPTCDLPTRAACRFPFFASCGRSSISVRW